MKKGVPFVWDQACQNAFDSIKQYLLNPLVLMSLALGKPLLLYVAAMESSLGALLPNTMRKARSMLYIILAGQWSALS